MEKDHMHTKCSCGGKFKDMSLHDDWEGTVTCDKCLKVIRRWSIPNGT